MSDIKLTFVVLKLLQLIIFIVYGRILSRTKSDRDFWLKAIIPVLTYSVITGLRFGRFIDYNVYYFRYVNLGESLNSEDYEPVFSYICHFLYNAGVPYYLFVFLQCAFLITTIFILIKNYRKPLLYILPLILFELVGNEMFIRWYLGFSFFLLALNSYINVKRIWYTFIWLLLAISTHVGFVVFAPVFLFGRILNEKTIPPKIATVIFLISTFMMSLSNLAFFTTISTALVNLGIGSNDMRVGNYLNATEALINGEFGNTGVMERTLSNNIRLAIAYAPTIWFAKEYVKKYKYGILFYNFFVMGAIVSPLFSLIEIFNRYALALTFFSCISSGILFYEVLQNKTKHSVIIFFICLFSFLSAIWPNVSGAYSLKSDNEMLFIWDANGRNYLPYWRR